ncbi:transferase [Lithospermum erythrorhizon]|uniref:Glutathione S-transferase n=1 Tax=Lithospermum erythrorhizon TaxID=34254 RepID=A0AAV3QW89_LITER
MATGDVKLLGSCASPFVLRVKIALNIKSINYEFIQENVNNKSELLLKSNPIHKKIPVLFHGDNNPICESIIIVEYINDVWSTIGPSILPSNPHDRSLARFWAAYIDNKLFAAFRELKNSKWVEAIEGVVNKIVEGFLVLEDVFIKCSKGKQFFGGETIGLIDIALGSGLPWFKVLERMSNKKLLDETKMPNIVAWADNFCQDPLVKGDLPDVEKLFELYTTMFMVKEQVAVLETKYSPSNSIDG